jgi:hypothetical protein
MAGLLGVGAGVATAAAATVGAGVGVEVLPLPGLFSFLHPAKMSPQSSKIIVK